MFTCYSRKNDAGIRAHGPFACLDVSPQFTIATLKLVHLEPWTVILIPAYSFLLPRIYNNNIIIMHVNILPSATEIENSAIFISDTMSIVFPAVFSCIKK